MKLHHEFVSFTLPQSFEDQQAGELICSISRMVVQSSHLLLAFHEKTREK